MTVDELKRIEQELGVDLPADYKRVMASFPWPELAGSTDSSLWDHAALNIERTLEYRAGYAGAPAWPKDYLHIGDDDDACPYALRCSDGSIVKTDHGNLTKPLETYSNIKLFVKALQDFDNEQ